MNSLLLGTGKAKIDWQDEDFPLKEYSGVRDSTYVRVFFLRQGSSPFAIVSIEATSLPDSAVKYFKQNITTYLNIEPEQIWLTVSHNFSSPHIGNDKHVNEVMYTRISNAVEKACKIAKNQEIVRVRLGRTNCLLNVNRNISTKKGWWLGRNSDGFSNHEVLVLIFTTLDKKIKSILYNYDIQSSVLDHFYGEDNSLAVSGDLVGNAAGLLENKYGQSVALFLEGAAGDQMPLFNKRSIELEKEQNINIEEFMLQEAIYLAECLVTAIKKSSYIKDVSLKSSVYGIKLPQQKMQIPTKKLAPHLKFNFETVDEPLETNIYVLELGEVTLLGLSPELNSSTGAKIKRIYNSKTVFVVTLVNGAMKYLPTENDFKNITYTAMNTFIGRGSEQLILDRIAQISSELRGD